MCYKQASKQIPWNEIEAKIYQKVFGDSTDPVSNTNTSKTTDPNTSNTTLSLTQSMQAIQSQLLTLTSLIQQLVQQQTQLSYQPQHSTTTKVKEKRHDPRNSSDDDQMPLCVAVYQQQLQWIFLN